MSTSNTSSGANKPAALIFLHGLGDTPAGWSSLEHTLPDIQPSLSKSNGVQYVFPPAPTIPLTINGGMRMPGWFDLYDWPIGVGVRNDDEGLDRAVKAVEDCVDSLEKGGVPRDRIVVGGFSQGGAVALRSAYHSKAKGGYAACVSLSGWVTFGGDDVKSGSADIPLFLAHGSQDDKVLFEQQQHAEMTLGEESKVNVIDSKSYPMGHSSHPKEMVDFANFLNKILFDVKAEE